MKLALLFAFLLSVELSYGFRYILMKIEPSPDQVDLQEDGKDYSLEEIDYNSPLREGDQNDYFMKELLNPKQENVEQEGTSESNEDNSNYMYQSLPDPAMRQPFSDYRAPTYYEPEQRFYNNYQPRSYYQHPSMSNNNYQPRSYNQHPSMFNNYYQPRSYYQHPVMSSNYYQPQNYYNRHASPYGHPWFYRFNPFYHTY